MSLCLRISPIPSVFSCVFVFGDVIFLPVSIPFFIPVYVPPIAVSLFPDSVTMSSQGLSFAIALPVCTVSVPAMVAPIPAFIFVDMLVCHWL